jgi:ABC-2 type transport system permease protein
VTLLPPWAAKLSYGNPILYMVNAFRHGFLGTSDVDPGLAFMIMGAFAVAMYVVVVMLMNRGVGIRE